MSEAEQESTVETFIVEDGVDSSLDMQVKILTPAGFGCRLVHLSYPPESYPGISMDVEMLRRILADIDRRIGVDS